MTDLVLGFLLVGPKTGPDVGKASPVGLFIVVLLLICVFILIWSMNRHLKRIPKSFDASEAPDAESGGVTTAESGGVDPGADDTERPARESGG